MHPIHKASSLILTSLATRLCPVIPEAQTMMVTQLTAAPPNIANDHHRVKPLSSALPVQKPSDQGPNDDNKPLFADLIALTKALTVHRHKSTCLHHLSSMSAHQFSLTPSSLFMCSVSVRDTCVLSLCQSVVNFHLLCVHRYWIVYLMTKCSWTVHWLDVGFICEQLDDYLLASWTPVTPTT